MRAILVIAMTSILCAQLAHAEADLLKILKRRDVIDQNGQGYNAVPWLTADYKILYFSAHWCGPCRDFTPEFVTYYRSNKARLGLEVLLVSSDNSLYDMQEYMKWGDMPWGGIYKHNKTGKKLSELYAGRGIPCVVVLDKTGAVVAHSYQDGRYRGPRAPLDDLEQLLANK